MEIIIRRFKKKTENKIDAVIDGKNTVPCGAKGCSDDTLHKDPERKERYINRHAGMRETWTTQGIKTPGCYARCVAWNKPTFRSSVDGLNKNIKNNAELEIQN